jgi:hypothetical protein
MKKAKIAACAAAVGLGAGIVTGTGMAAADIETDATDPPSNSTGGLGPTVDAVGGVVTDIAKGGKITLTEIRVTVHVSVSSPRITTNHSLTSARLV